MRTGVFQFLLFILLITPVKCYTPIENLYFLEISVFALTILLVLMQIVLLILKCKSYYNKSVQNRPPEAERIYTPQSFETKPPVLVTLPKSYYQHTHDPHIDIDLPMLTDEAIINFEEPDYVYDSEFDYDFYSEYDDSDAESIMPPLVDDSDSDYSDSSIEEIDYIETSYLYCGLDFPNTAHRIGMDLLKYTINY